MLKSKMSTAESFIALGGIIVGFTTCFIAGAPRGSFLDYLSRATRVAALSASLPSATEIALK